MAAPNIVNVSTITGRSNSATITTTANTILTNPASSGQVLKVNNLIITNTGGSNTLEANVVFYNSSAAASHNITSQTEVPAKDSLTVLSKPFYLEEGDYLQVSANTGGGLSGGCHATVSYEELS